MKKIHQFLSNIKKKMRAKEYWFPFLPHSVLTNILSMLWLIGFLNFSYFLRLPIWRIKLYIFERFKVTKRFQRVTHKLSGFYCIRLVDSNRGFITIIIITTSGVPRPGAWQCLRIDSMYTWSEVTSQNLWPRYERHFVGITWHNVCS